MNMLRTNRNGQQQENIVLIGLGIKVITEIELGI